MKWFKHQSTARNDEKIARLEDKAGLEGYGFYFKMLELVAEVIDSTDRCEVTYSVSRWGRQANVTTKKFLFLSQCCADVGLMIVRRCDDDMTINIPNLLKYRDNHTKNLQVACKQEKEEEVDKEKDKETKKADGDKSPNTPAKEKFNYKKFPTPDCIDRSSWDDWMEIRKRKKAEMTELALSTHLKTLLECEAKGILANVALTLARTNGWKGIRVDWVVNTLACQSEAKNSAQIGERQRKVLN